MKLRPIPAPVAAPVDIARAHRELEPIVVAGAPLALARRQEEAEPHALSPVPLPIARPLKNPHLEDED